MKRLVLALLLPFAAHGADAENGRRIATGRQDGNCLLCHAIPGADRPAGNFGPSLAGIASRFSPDELRERIRDASRFNPKTVMPPYGRTEGLHDVASQYRGKPVLTPGQIDDVVAFLLTLR